MQVRPRKHDSWLGVTLKGSIVCLWGISLVQALRLSLDCRPIWLIVSAVLGRTFLHTGLFIVAHDAMHQSLKPQHLRLNIPIGRIARLAIGFIALRALSDKSFNPPSLSSPERRSGLSQRSRTSCPVVPKICPGISSSPSLASFASSIGLLFLILSALLHFSRSLCYPQYSFAYLVVIPNVLPLRLSLGAPHLSQPPLVPFASSSSHLLTDFMNGCALRYYEVM